VGAWPWAHRFLCRWDKVTWNDEEFSVTYVCLAEEIRGKPSVSHHLDHTIPENLLLWYALAHEGVSDRATIRCLPMRSDACFRTTQEDHSLCSEVLTSVSEVCHVQWERTTCALSSRPHLMWSR
jgi:hypothetical protein